MHDCQAKVLITADGAWRGEKILHLKDICDEAMTKADGMGHHVDTCIVVAHINRVTPGMPDWDGTFDVSCSWRSTVR